MKPPRGLDAARPNPRDESLELQGERLIQEHDLIPSTGSIVVGVSGGPDSVALLDFLLRYRERTGRPDGEIVAGHVNHGLRGKESEEDAEFVGALAGELGVRFMSTRVNPADDRAGATLEESARKLRYDALRRMATAVRTERVAVAHTADDQAETVLLRLIRGAGIAGLAGMRPLRKIHRLELIRPLLATTREQVLEYVNKRELSYRVDSSNSSTDPRRNFVRLEILPRIQAMNPAIRETLLRESALFREVEGYLAAEADQALQRVVLNKDQGKIELDVEKLLLYPKLLRKYVLRYALQELNGDILDLSKAHIDALHALLTSHSGRSADVPMGIQARHVRGILVMSKRGEEPKAPKRRSNT